MIIASRLDTGNGNLDLDILSTWNLGRSNFQAPTKIKEIKWTQKL